MSLEARNLQELCLFLFKLMDIWKNFLKILVWYYKDHALPVPRKPLGSARCLPCRRRGSQWLLLTRGASSGISICPTCCFFLPGLLAGVVIWLVWRRQWGIHGSKLSDEMDRLSLRNEEQKKLVIGNILMMKEILHQLINSFSHYCKLLYIPGGAGFLPSTVSGI